MLKINIFLLGIKTILGLGMVVHIFNPSYLGGRDQEQNGGSRPAQAES
jgi:hypothetical protein